MTINASSLNHQPHVLNMQLLDLSKSSSIVYALYVYDNVEMKQSRLQDHKHQFSKPNIDTPKTWAIKGLNNSLYVLQVLKECDYVDGATMDSLEQ